MAVNANSNECGFDRLRNLDCPISAESRLSLPTMHKNAPDVSRAGTPRATDRYFSLSRLRSAYRAVSPAIWMGADWSDTIARWLSSEFVFMRVESPVRRRVSRRRRAAGARVGAQQGDSGVWRRQRRLDGASGGRGAGGRRPGHRRAAAFHVRPQNGGIAD